MDKLAAALSARPPPSSSSSAYATDAPEGSIFSGHGDDDNTVMKFNVPPPSRGIPGLNLASLMSVGGKQKVPPMPATYSKTPIEHAPRTVPTQEEKIASEAEAKRAAEVMKSVGENKSAAEMIVDLNARMSNVESSQQAIVDTLHRMENMMMGLQGMIMKLNVGVATVAARPAPGTKGGTDAWLGGAVTTTSLGYGEREAVVACFFMQIHRIMSRNLASMGVDFASPQQLKINDLVRAISAICRPPAEAKSPLGNIVVPPSNDPHLTKVARMLGGVENGQPKMVIDEKTIADICNDDSVMHVVNIIRTIFAQLKKFKYGLPYDFVECMAVLGEKFVVFSDGVYSIHCNYHQVKPRPPTAMEVEAYNLPAKFKEACFKGYMTGHRPDDVAAYYTEHYMAGGKT